MVLVPQRQWRARTSWPLKVVGNFPPANVENDSEPARRLSEPLQNVDVERKLDRIMELGLAVFFVAAPALVAAPRLYVDGNIALAITAQQIGDPK